MRESPILFSAPMVRPTLDGRKTVMRLTVKLPHQNPLGNWEPTSVGGRDAKGNLHPEQAAIWHTRTGDALTCPYGVPGDRLWVRETFKPIASGEVKNGYGEVRYGYAYKADGATRWNARPTIIHDLTGQPSKGPMQFQRRPWRSPATMPHRASRITLEVTGVRVERLQDISEEQARAEGVFPAKPIDHRTGEPLDHVQFERPHFVGFASLWNEINGAGSWEANPWVWVVEFRRIEQEARAA